MEYHNNFDDLHYPHLTLSTLDAFCLCIEKLPKLTKCNKILEKYRYQEKARFSLHQAVARTYPQHAKRHFLYTIPHGESPVGDTFPV